MEIYIDDTNERSDRLSSASRASSIVNDKKWEWGILRVSNLITPTIPINNPYIIIV